MPENIDIEKLSQTQNEYMKQRFSTKYSQYNYDLKEMQTVSRALYALLLLYFIFSAIYLGIIFVGPNRDKTSYVFKGCAVAFLVLFPFCITPVEYYLFRGFRFVVETSLGSVYQKDDYEFLLDTRFLPTFF
jgi:hypothetical protein